MLHITSITYKNYKSFSDFKISLKGFNILVGPNNAGKSTIIGSFKILSEGLKKARHRKPVLINGPDGNDLWGYQIDLSSVPVATENVFHNYDDSSSAVIKFKLSDGAYLQLFFPEEGRCYLNYNSPKVVVRAPKDFKKYVDISIGFVPILGPVEHEERLYQLEAARQALLSYTASRNFRNIWFHYSSDFHEFKELIRSTWPGMDINFPERITTPEGDQALAMFCPEERIPREIFWAGFGFQVWCQMLTYIIKSKQDTIFLIDEPDIYLHSDLQRQLLGILKALGPDIIIATHSTELISEAELNDILLINKVNKSAKRIKDPSQLQNIFNVLGSNLNPILTQIAKSKRVLFVEGKDFSILSKVARLIKYDKVANRSDFAVVPVEGFNPSRLKALKDGIEKTIGSQVRSAVIFDRDFRSKNEINSVLKQLEKSNDIVHIHSCKEIENFVLLPSVIEKALIQRISEYNRRTNSNIEFNDNISAVILELSDVMKYDTQAQLQSYREKFERSIGGKDDSNIKVEILKEFDDDWGNLNSRLKMIPGKDFLSALSSYFQENYHVTVSISNIVYHMNSSTVPKELVDIIEKIEQLRTSSI